MASLRQTLGAALALLSFSPSVLAAPASFSNPQAQLSALIGHAPNGSNTDLYIHMEAPDSAGWGAIAMGQEMAGSLFFVMYPNQDGSGATVSVRTTPANVMPMMVPGIEHRVTNSTNKNGVVTADFVCYGCTRWATGSLDTTSDSTNWIYAVGPGQQVESNDEAAQLVMHKIRGNFMANMAEAAIATPAESDMSPLLPFMSGSTAPPPAPVGDDDDNESDILMLIVAHATVLCLAFYFFMPVGIVLLRLPPVMKTNQSVRLHYASMGIAWVLAIAGVGMAIYLSRNIGEPLFTEFKSYHQAIGLTATCATIVQAFLGLAHHLLFRKLGKRTFITYTHMFLGWCILTLGLLNAPIGFALLENIPARNGMIALCVILIVFCASISAWGWSFMAKKNKTQSSSEKRSSESDAGVTQMTAKAT